MANDLTRRQIDIVAQAKREGKAAYFVRGKMTIGPKRADPRSYAQAITDTGADIQPTPSFQPRPFVSSPTPLPTHPSTQSPLSLPDRTSEGNRTSLGARSRVDRQRETETGASPSRTEKSLPKAGGSGPRQTTGQRSGPGAPAASGGKQQQGISSYLRGQQGAATRPTLAGASQATRTLRSSVNSK